jgi:hypothetical protein
MGRSVFCAVLPLPVGVEWVCLWNHCGTFLCPVSGSADLSVERGRGCGGVRVSGCAKGSGVCIAGCSSVREGVRRWSLRLEYCRDGPNVLLPSVQLRRSLLDIPPSSLCGGLWTRDVHLEHIGFCVVVCVPGGLDWTRVLDRRCPDVLASMSEWRVLRIQ